MTAADLKLRECPACEGQLGSPVVYYVKNGLMELIGYRVRCSHDWCIAGQQRATESDAEAAWNALPRRSDVETARKLLDEATALLWEQSPCRRCVGVPHLMRGCSSCSGLGITPNVNAFVARVRGGGA